MHPLTKGEVLGQLIPLLLLTPSQAVELVVAEDPLGVASRPDVASISPCWAITTQSALASGTEPLASLQVFQGTNNKIVLPDGMNDAQARRQLGFIDPWWYTPWASLGRLLMRPFRRIFGHP